MKCNALSRSGLAALIAMPCLAHFVCAEVPQADAKNAGFQYHRPDVLGTTLDLTLVAPSQAEADACAETIFQEIERLRKILSTYDEQSEISRFQANRETSPIPVSPELHDVLAGYVHWRYVSGGAYSLQLGDLLKLWSDAEKKGTPPADVEIEPLLARSRENALVISGSTIRKMNNQKLNIDSAGKGYIVQKAAAAGKAAHPLVTGILLNIGGDITAIGSSVPAGTSALPGSAMPWKISISDPQQPADVAPAILTFTVKDKSVATSGTYERFYTFGEKKLSHILNPLTGKPSTNNVLSATVVANDNVTANALATILCVLPPADGIKLVEKTPGAAAFLIMNSGQQLESKGFAGYKLPSDSSASPASTSPSTAPTDSPSNGAAAGNWPKNFAVSIDLTELPFPPHPNYVPYTTLWIENASGRCVKILAAWIGDSKYLRSMRRFPQACKSSPDYAAMTRATRPVGHYTIPWDGTDSSRNPVARGQYFLAIEVCCEHGGHSIAKQLITCGDAANSTTLAGAAMWTTIAVNYGPPGAKTDAP